LERIQKELWSKMHELDKTENSAEATHYNNHDLLQLQFGYHKASSKWCCNYPSGAKTFC